MSSHTKIVLIQVLSILIFSGIVLCVPFYERIGVSGGLGFDGENYAALTRSVVAKDFLHVYDAYSVQRYSVPFLIGSVALLFNIQLTDLLIADLFGIANVLFLLGSVIFFYKTCALLNFDRKTQLFAFISMFFSFFVLKMTGYYPVLLDCPAFAIGIILYYSYLSNNFKLGLVCIFIGAFTFPSISMFGILMFASKSISITYGDNSSFFYGKEKFIKILKVAFPYLTVLFYLTIAGVFFFVLNAKLIFPSSEKGNFIRIACSILATCLMIYYVVKNILTEEVFNLLHLKSIKANTIHLFMIGVVFILIKIGIYLLANHEVRIRMTSIVFVVNLLLQSIQNPFSSIVSHIMYFGPVILLAIIFFNSIAVKVKKEGFIFAMVFVLNIIIMILGNESRQFIVFIPILIFYTCDVIKEKLNVPIILLHGVISLLLSRFWYTINSNGFGRSTSKMGGFATDDCQRYFMSQGPWMTNSSYMVFALTVTVLIVIYWYLFKVDTPKKTFVN